VRAGEIKRDVRINDGNVKKSESNFTFANERKFIDIKMRENPL
jgi:hypothetical protein